MKIEKLLGNLDIKRGNILGNILRDNPVPNFEFKKM